MNVDIRSAEETMKAVLKKHADSSDAAVSTCIQADLWCSGCKLGRLQRNRQTTRDLAVWTKGMVRSAGVEIIPLLGGIWRMQDHFEPHTMSFQVMDEVFTIIASLQHADPEITAGTVFEKLDVEAKRAFAMLDYINAIYAGWDEYKHPTFITRQIQEALADNGQHRAAALSDAVDRIEFSLEKFSYGPAREPSDVASIYINGTSVRLIIREAELPSAARNGTPNKAGGYAWLTVGELVEELTEDRDPADEYYVEPRIMDCGCGCSECWPLYVNITETEDRVIWSGFYNSWTIDPEMAGIPWDYSGMREYRFDKKQYYDELEKLKDWCKEKH